MNTMNHSQIADRIFEVLYTDLKFLNLDIDIILDLTSFKLVEPIDILPSVGRFFNVIDIIQEGLVSNNITIKSDAINILILLRKKITDHVRNLKVNKLYNSINNTPSKVNQSTNIVNNTSIPHSLNISNTASNNGTVNSSITNTSIMFDKNKTNIFILLTIINSMDKIKWNN